MIHIEAWMFGAISAFIGVLLAVIAFFLARGLSRFDKLNATVESLVRMLGLIDGDVKGMHQRVLNVERDTERRQSDAGILYQRVNAPEKDVAIINASGCGSKHDARCITLLPDAAATLDELKALTV